MNINDGNNYNSYANINFCALNKNQLNRTQRIFKEIFKPELEKMNGISDLQKASEDIFQKETIPTDLVGRQQELQPWVDKLIEMGKKVVDGDFWKSIAMNSINKIDYHIPLCDEEILLKTFSDLAKGKTDFVNFEKEYGTRLRNKALKKYFPDGDYNGWVKIERTSDKEKLAEKVDDIRRLSIGTTWCTKSNLFSTLVMEDGNFYIYFENSEPKLGIRTIFPKVGYGAGQELTAEIKNRFNMPEYSSFSSVIKEFSEKFNVVKYADNICLLD